MDDKLGAQPGTCFQVAGNARAPRRRSLEAGGARRCACRAPWRQRDLIV